MRILNIFNKMEKIFFFQFLLLFLFLYFQCKFFEKEDKVGFGKKWMDGPHQEVLESNIYYIRDENSVSEQTFSLKNLDPRAFAKLGVVPYVRKLEGYFKNKNYEDVAYELDTELSEAIAIKYGLLKKIENENGDLITEKYGEPEIERYIALITSSLKAKKGICNLTKFFEVPYERIEIRAYQAFDPRLDFKTKEPKEYFFTYRIDFVHNLDPSLEEDSEDRTHAITISMQFNPKSNSTRSGISRVINHCPIPELQDPDEE
ncbi:hypothetical protein EHR02_12875 [Leptospira levettii]|uniref:hypothetical protein n=1 Tax=Leptospira levettii TaxID=2023178 RepID=UPI001083D333|nr:hypothetical protein [Leptospira levettii]TGM93613.1 hypothetical protein EHR02_12875 [Leptospira levettii]